MQHQNPHVTVEFPPAQSIGPRDWGQELLLVHAPGKYTFKLLKMKAGHKGGLQAHRVKDESQYILSGHLLVRFDNGDGKLSERTLSPGEWIHIPPGAIHQEEALTDCDILEASNPVFNDRVRLEEKYGLSVEGGLPTTEFPSFR